MLGSMPMARAITKPGRTEWAIRLASNTRRWVISNAPVAGQMAPISSEIVSGRSHQMSGSATAGTPHHASQIAQFFADRVG